VVEKRKRYVERQKSLPVPSLVFLDEFGVQPGMNRLYGWSVCGKPPVITRQLRSRRLNAVGAMTCEGPRALMSYTGSMNEERMLEYVHEHLGPTLNEGDIVVVDGLRVHTMDSVRQAVESFGGTVLVLPPYSPELNPIEMVWSVIKARLRAMGGVAWADLESKLHTLWDTLELEFFPRWVRHCGYTQST
jgi:transposase